MTHEEREALRGLCEEATSGPWIASSSCDGEVVYRIRNGDYYPIIAAERAVDAAFIAAARTALPELLDALKAAEPKAQYWYDEYCAMKARAEAAEARAEALERALREFAPCKTCVGAPDCKIYGQALVCTLFGFKPDAWQFDQARFAKGDAE